MKSNSLTIKQEAFAQAYIRLGDSTASFKEVGYSYKNKTAKSIHECACRVFKNSKVQSRIKELQAEVAAIAVKKFNIDSTEMLRHLNILRQARIDEYVEYVEFDYPVTTSITTGKGKASVTTTSVTVERRTEIRFKTFDKLTEDQLMCIESIKQNRYGEVELKLHGKEWTIDKINKHIGFYEKDNSQKKDETNIKIDMSKLSDAALEELEKAYLQEEE